MEESVRWCKWFPLPLALLACCCLRWAMLGVDRRQAARAGRQLRLSRKRGGWGSQYPELEADCIKTRKTTVENYSSPKFSNLNRKDLETGDADYFTKLNLDLNSLALFFLKVSSSKKKLMSSSHPHFVPKLYNLLRHFKYVLVTVLHAFALNAVKGFKA